MLTQGQEITNGRVYKIRNRRTQRIMAASLSEVRSVCDLGTSQQLWVVDRSKGGEFQIREMRSGEVLTWVQGKSLLRVEKPRMRNYLWDIDRAEVLNNITYFWIKPAKTTHYCLAASSLSHKLKVSSMDQTLGICLWEFVECDLKGDDFRGLSVIRSSANLVLAVGEHSVKVGVGVTQQQYNGCGSQRWIIQAYHDDKEGKQKEYILRNFCSGLILTANNKISGRVTQDCFCNTSTQRWILHKVAETVFTIQSAADEHFYLSVGSEKEGAAVVVNQDQKISSWVIEGHYPHL